MSISCSNEFFPQGLYDYQVERLLSGGDSKEWFFTSDDLACQDSVRLLFQLEAFAEDDSLIVSEIFKGQSCSPDTMAVGKCDASSFTDVLLFTDTLNFDSGEQWIISEVSSDFLTFRQLPSENFQNLISKKAGL